MTRMKRRQEAFDEAGSLSRSYQHSSKTAETISIYTSFYATTLGMIYDYDTIRPCQMSVPCSKLGRRGRVSLCPAVEVLPSPSLSQPSALCCAVR